ncbi:hypothetical protein [Chryseobacterium sp. KCF3-3]|uniref:hypothetical protein n=1 Tax=Chryseobacterium sp. KCF3-3 TaxID=3231511 RepID=UPI0038B4121C
MNSETTYKVPPAYSYSDIAKMKFNTLPFEGDWKELIGTPEVAGSWIIWGKSGNGKTRFALQLAKYLAGFQKVYYNSLEEGLKLSFKNALEANNIKSVGSKFCFHKEKLQQMRARLDKDRSPNIVIIDSLQHFRIKESDYYSLLEDYPKKLFIFISHAQGTEPKGELADEIRYNSDVKIRVHQFVASPVENTRYGGNKPYIIWDEGMRNAQIKLT